MEELSNKTIAVLLVIAVVVSIGGTLLSINKLSRMGAPLATGQALWGTGKINFSVTQLDEVTVTGSIDFGTGRVHANSTQASLNSSLTGTANGTWVWTASAITVNNSGNSNLSINFTTNVTAAQFIDGAGSTAQIWSSSVPGGGSACTVTLINYNTATTALCTKLQAVQYGANTNWVNVSAYVLVPATTLPGTKASLLNFTGTTV